MIVPRISAEATRVAEQRQSSNQRAEFLGSHLLIRQSEVKFTRGNIKQVTIPRVLSSPSQPVEALQTVATATDTLRFVFCN